MAAERQILRVTELNRLAKTVLEDEIGHVWVEGELSNFIHHGSGHMYFSIKDEKASIQAAMFRGAQGGLKIQPRNGMLVHAYGQVTMFEAMGKYQIICRQIEEAGKGSLQEAFEKLKLKLEAEGLFAPERKKPLPALPRHIGLVTSPTGAAIRDILNVIDRRFPNMHIVVSPARVQGEGAAEEIARGIERLNRLGGIEVMMVGRGGGSLEDLWAFNEEVVARAIAASEIPVISAVGHEIDFTICDFVADRRAETPSAAAEMIVGPREETETRLKQFARRLEREATYRLREEQQKVDEASVRFVRLLERTLDGKHRDVQALRNRLAALSPQARLKNHAQRIEKARAEIARLTERSIREERTKLNSTQTSLLAALQWHVQAQRETVTRQAAKLEAMNPGLVLKRGFSLTRTLDGKVLTSADQVKTGARIETLLADGRLISDITDRTKGAPNG